ncbi:trypsin-1 [Drosophila montana]|uniref:trypsin-1 n=1 Tax=Drosophila montana TaxID=40370 RepID=UPI00313CD380
MSHHRKTLLLPLLLACIGCLAVPPPPAPQLRLRLDGRIVGGIEVTIKDYPYQISLQRNYHMCGGSLIADGWALTAAHCVENANVQSLRVRIGATRKDSGGVLADIQRVHRHPKYDPRIIDYDFALLELAQYNATNITQAFVQLPKQNEDIPDGTPVTITGWGNTQNAEESTDVLRAVTVPKVNQTQCTLAYDNFGNITDRMLCAGLQEGGKDACQGDSGGPLAAHGKLWGVVSWGFGCAKPEYPGVYSRVAAVRDWIVSVSGV